MLLLSSGTFERFDGRHRIACARTVARWYAAQIRIPWKASESITHWKRLSAKCENSIALMETGLQALARKDCIVCFSCRPTS